MSLTSSAFGSLSMKRWMHANHLRIIFVVCMSMVFVLTLLNIRQTELVLPARASTPWPRKPVIITQSRSIVPLQELTNSFAAVTCPDDMKPVLDSLGDAKMAFRNRHIPRIVHLTGKSRCVHPIFAENVELWKLPDHSLFYHDDSAMDQLLYRDWPEFPHLKYVLNCVTYGGAVKADIWRLLVLWEYGGIYADFDSRPNRFNETTITPDDEVFLVMDKDGVPSQWFMSSSPRHPFIYCTIQALLLNLIELKDVGDLDIVWKTGPGAISGGFSKFLGLQGAGKRKRPDVSGVYTGSYGHTVRIAGTHDDQNEIIERNIFETLLREKSKDPHGVKHGIYETMNMTHFTRFGHRKQFNWKNESCVWRMWREEMKEAVQWSPSW